MELAESIESINNQLREQFGIDTASTSPMFKIVWSNDQHEMRETNCTKEGLLLLTPMVVLMPKYQWFKERYVLERLVGVPEFQQKELAGKKVSYEPLWVFQGKNDTYVAPTFWACKFIIDTMYAALGKKSMVKYVDEEAKNPEEHREARINKLEEELFGDESFLKLRTVTGEAVAYTGPSKIKLTE